MILSFSDTMPDPELSERFWTEKAASAFIRRAICLEADTNVKPEMAA